MKTKLSLTLLLLMAFMASTAFARVPRKNPTAYDQGTIAYDNSQYAKAIEWMDKALAKNPENGFALAYKGSSQRLLGQQADAVKSLQRATELIDDTNCTFRAWAHSECFFALVEMGDSLAALDEIDLAIKDNDREYSYLQNRGVIKAGLGQLDEALVDYDKALAMKPDDSSLQESRDRLAKLVERNRQAQDINNTEYYVERDTTAADEIVLPEFPGGMKALTAYINGKTGWDDSKKPVRVNVDVTIDKTGHVTDAVIVKGYDKKLDKKALEICKQLPRFAPATQKGFPVPCTITVPVRFVDPNFKK